MPHQIIELCQQGASINYKDSFRQGNIIELPEKESIVVTGDLHGNRRNFERIVSFADLANHPHRHVLLQEIIHGGEKDEQGGCLSFLVLFEAIRYKLEFPDQVHFIMGNHDTACIGGTEVSKGGEEMNRSMQRAMQLRYKDDYPAIYESLKVFLLSQPLALKTANRIWMSHSLPADRYVDHFDLSIFRRSLTQEDVLRPGSVYFLTWGRRHSDDALRTLAELLDVELFILGHQNQDAGWGHAGENLIILASDHMHGCFIELETSHPYTVEQLKTKVRPLAAIA